MTAPTFPGNPPLAALLDAMGAELRSLGTLADHVQEVLSPALSSAVLSGPGVLTGLQDLDRLAQVARALATVASRLSDTAGRGAAVDPEAVLDAVSLADLARRLGAKRPSKDPVGEDCDDMFTVPSCLSA